MFGTKRRLQSQADMFSGVAFSLDCETVYIKTLELINPSSMSLIRFPASPRSAQFGDVFYSPMRLHGSPYLTKGESWRASKNICRVPVYQLSRKRVY
jgi:hypothetical protein